MNLDLIGTGYLSQKGIVARDEDDQKHERSVAAPRWGAMFHPVLGQVWTHPDAESAPDLEQILLEESMHVQQTLNRPAHLFPLRRYLNCDPDLPDAEVFRDIVECQYVALTPLLLRQPIASGSLPPAPNADREAAERILEMVEKLAVQDVTDLTTEQRRRYALSAITTVTGAVIPAEAGSLGRTLDTLADAVERVEWQGRFRLESFLAEATGLPVRSSLWPDPWRGYREPALDRSMLSPSEAMLINALHVARCVLTDPESALPVLPSLNAVLSRRNDVPMVLARPRGSDVVDFEILEHQERIEHQGGPVSEALPAAETDEDVSPVDEAWFRFDDRYLGYLADRDSPVTVGDYTVAALQGLSSLLQQDRGPVLERLGLLFSGIDVLWHDLKSRCSAPTWRHDVTPVERTLRAYGDWLEGEGKQIAIDGMIL